MYNNINDAISDTLKSALMTKLSLPKGAQIHHVDCNPKNNENSNLVICPNQEYHALLHIRTRALEACGNADWRKCTHCQQWDDPRELVQYSAKVWRHKECEREYLKAYRKNSSQ